MRRGADPEPASGYQGVSDGFSRIRKGHPIRVADIDGQPWFVGADVLKVLFGQAGDRGRAYSRLDDTEKTKVCRGHLGMSSGKPMVLVSESGLYKLVMRSDKPEARAFQDWVTRDVLPAIRKDGGYTVTLRHVGSDPSQSD